MPSFCELFEQAAAKRRRKIGIAILRPIAETIDSLRRASKYADLVVIGAKVDGAIHIAFGSNGTFGVGKDDHNFNNCNIHCDNIIGIQTPLTVECVKKDKTRFYLIENGQPIDY